MKIDYNFYWILAYVMLAPHLDKGWALFFSLVYVVLIAVGKIIEWAGGRKQETMHDGPE